MKKNSLMWKIIKISRSRRRYLWNKRRKLQQANSNPWLHKYGYEFQERQMEIDNISDLLNRGFEEQWTTKTK